MRVCALFVVFTGALVATTTGCAPAAAGDVRATADRFVADVREAHPQAACGLLSARVRDTMLRQHRQPCEQVLPGEGIPGAPVTDVTVWGAEAQARAADDVLFLHEFGEGWRITGAGCQPRGEQQRYVCAVGGA